MVYDYTPDQWPPAGHRMSYDTQILNEDGEGAFRLSFAINVPRQGIDMSTMRVGRIGGPTYDDLEFRNALFLIIGSITVAGAHVEAAMKRLLLVLSTEVTTFGLVDFQWADLEKKLAAECGGRDRRRLRLSRILDWATELDIRERRNTAVHGSWWLHKQERTVASRWPRKKNDAILIGSLGDLRALENDCWTLVAKLDRLLGEDWPRAVFAEETVPASFRRAERS